MRRVMLFILALIAFTALTGCGDSVRTIVVTATPRKAVQTPSAPIKSSYILVPIPAPTINVPDPTLGGADAERVDEEGLQILLQDTIAQYENSGYELISELPVSGVGGSYHSKYGIDRYYLLTFKVIGEGVK